MFDPLIFVRLIHFSATISVTGAIFFLGFVAEPAFAEAKSTGDLPADMRRRLVAISWIGLTVAIISGVAWLFLLASQMADLPLADALSEGAIWTVLTETDFGQAWTLRLVLAGFLAVSLPWIATPRPTIARRSLAAGILLASALVGTLAWAGHAAAGTGVDGNVHLAADVLHLIAAAAWLGALVPLAFLLRAAAADAHQASMPLARAVVLRFSTLGVASVGTLVGSGLINTWMLAGNLPALIGTDYGRLLVAKIMLFVAMLSFAAVNRLWLTPRLVLAPSMDASKGVLEQVGRNTLIEAALGVIVMLAVSILGTLPPGLDALN